MSGVREATRSGGQAVLVGGALDPETVDSHRGVSVAAARWQMGFATAIASEWRSPVTCLSYLPIFPGEPAANGPSGLRGVTIIPIARPRVFGGSIRYVVKMLREVWRLRRSTSQVFCYNPLPWTAPWAYLLGLVSDSPVVLIVADFELRSSGSLRHRMQVWVERMLLRPTRRYLLLSPRMSEVVRRDAKVAVFNGLADQDALAWPQPRYGGRVKFVYTGTLTREAGIYTFIAAAERLADERADAEFHIFGRGELSMRPSPALAERLRFHGYLSTTQLNAFLSDDCVGVNPRQVQGGANEFNAPYKLLHYLSRGLVTLTTVTEGVPPDLAEVCICADDGPEGVAEAMRRVLRMSPEKLDLVAARGRERVRETRSPQALGMLARDLVAPL